MVVIYIIFDFETIFCSQFVSSLMIQLHTKIHMLNATGPSVTTAKPKAYEKFCTVICYFFRF